MTIMNQDNVTELPGAFDQPVRQQRPDFTPASFGCRLRAALDELHMPEAERAATVAKAGGVTIRTARRWLKGHSQPRGTANQLAVAEALEIRPGWLLFGYGCKTEADHKRLCEFLEAYRKNPPWRQRLIERTLTRMANKSPRVERLQTLKEQGKLSPDEFLRLAGR